VNTDGKYAPYIIGIDSLDKVAIMAVNTYKMLQDSSLMMWMDGGDTSTYDLNSDGYVTNWRSKGYYNNFYVGGATGLSATSSSSSAHLIPSDNGILGNGAYLKSFNGSFMIDSSFTCFLVFDYNNTHSKNIFGHYELNQSVQHKGGGMAIGRNFLGGEFSWDTWGVYNKIEHEFEPNTKYIYTITHQKDTSTNIWLQKQEQTLTVTGVPYLKSSKSNSTYIQKMGLFCGHSTSPYGGHIYELVWYNRRLTNEEITDVQNYLIYKHNIPNI